MPVHVLRSSLLIVIAAALCSAQAPLPEWEIGGSAGYGFFRNQDVTRDNVTGKAGFKNGLAVSALGGHYMHRYLSGEVRYTYRDSDIKIKSAGTEHKFRGDSHVVHYDAMLHPGREARIVPFFAFGGGVRVFRGTGTETAAPPLSNLAVPTHADETKPLLSLGGGIRYRLSNHAVLRLDFRDYITPFPKEVVTPHPRATLSGWLHDFVPMFGISAVF